jgi:predicted nucleic acid-binding protein
LETSTTICTALQKEVKSIFADTVYWGATFYARERGPYFREGAVRSVRRVLLNARVRVYPQSRASFLEGLQLYEQRPDKGYSLVDCISMIKMREEGITEILTNDHHFAQEGFKTLLR